MRKTSVFELQPSKESFQASREQVDMSTKDSEPTGTTRQKGKRQNPMDKGPTGLVSGTVHQCKFCEKVCTSESGLTNHINNVHQERQNIFRCCKCGRKYNVFNMYIEHLGTTQRTSTSAMSVVSSSRTPTYCHFTALPT